MEELYLITVIGKLQIIASCVCGLSFLLGGIFVALCFETDLSKERTALIKIAKRFIVAGCISGIILCFCPSKEDLFFIYGGGSIIDYVQSSDAAKEIPEKALNALNLWINNLQE